MCACVHLFKSVCVCCVIIIEGGAERFSINITDNFNYDFIIAKCNLCCGGEYAFLFCYIDINVYSFTSLSSLPLSSFKSRLLRRW